MEAWTHYFTFKHNHKYADYWVEIIAKSNRKAEKQMTELYGSEWDRHYSGYSGFSGLKRCTKGCLSRHEAE